jgi:hypothetical protein
MKREVYADAQSAINRLLMNGINVDSDRKTIVFSGRIPGIKLWGAIDYLCHRCGYSWGKSW